MKQEVFELQGKTLKNVYFVRGEFQRGDYGTITISFCGELKIKETQTNQICLRAANGYRYTCAAQEPANAGERFQKTEPYNRWTRTYLPLGFEEADIFATTNQSRFLVLKKQREDDPDSHIELSSTKSDDSSAFVCDLQELPEVVGMMMQAIGVPGMNQEALTSELLTRIGN